MVCGTVGSQSQKNAELWHNLNKLERTEKPLFILFFLF